MDRLGLFKVKFQAKRWQNTHSVTVHEIRDFIGALTTERTENGVFVTTSDFTEDAIDTALRSGKVRLVSGLELVRIMIDTGLGVRKTTLDIPRIDEEYFIGLT